MSVPANARGGHSHREDGKRERLVALTFRCPFCKVEPDDLGGRDPDRDSGGEADCDRKVWDCVGVCDSCCCRPPNLRDCGWEQEVRNGGGTRNGKGVAHRSSGVLGMVTKSVSRGVEASFGGVVVAGVLCAVIE